MPRQHFQDVEQAALQQVSCEATGLSRLGLNQWCGEVAACHAGASLSYTRVLYLGSGYLESGAANCLVGLVAGTEIFLLSPLVEFRNEFFGVEFANCNIKVAFGRVCRFWTSLAPLQATSACSQMRQMPL